MDDVVDCALHPIQCTGGAIESVATNTATDVIERMLNGLFEAIVFSLVKIQTVWMDTPTASLSPDDAVGGAITQTQAYIAPITAFLGVLGLMVACGRMAWTARAEPVRDMGAMLMKVVFAQAAALSGTQILLRSGDEFSTWLLDTVMEQDMQHSLATLMPFVQISGSALAMNGSWAVTQAIGGYIVLAIIALLSAIMQFLFLILRDVLLAILLTVLPSLAAASLTKGGSEGFEKAQGWIVAMLLYKPTAAMIYTLGLLMIKGQGGSAENPADAWAGMLLGTLTLALATLALPALIKFVAPAAGRGVSNAFSGGAALGAAAGVAATGAAVVAVVGTGGAAAPAAGAAGAGGTAGSIGGGTASAAGATSSAAPTAGGAPGGGGASGGGGAPGGGSGGGKVAEGAPASGSGSGGGKVAEGAPASGSGSTGDDSKGGSSGGSGGTGAAVENVGGTSDGNSSGSNGSNGSPAGAPAAPVGSGGTSGSSTARDVVDVASTVSGSAQEGTQASGAAVEDMT